MRFFRQSIVFLLFMLVLPVMVATAQTNGQQITTLRRQWQRLTPAQQEDVRWLARCIYSESDRGNEQRLVAWVVRNRVETGFRGNTYRNVVLEPYQFSAFNEPTIRRNQLLRLDENSITPGWREALGIAMDVYQAPASERPFSVTTRHFYSPVSMEGGRTPDWADASRQLSSQALKVDPNRFRFFDNVDEGKGGGATADRPSLASNNLKNKTGTQPRRWKVHQRIRSVKFSGRVKRPARPRVR